MLGMMTSTSALIAYLISISLILPAILKPQSIYQKILFVMGASALVFHGIYLHTRMLSSAFEMQLGLLNIGSLVSIIISIFALTIARKDKGWQVLPVALSFGLINLIVTAFFPEHFSLHLEATPLLLVHIGLALLSYSLLFIAALYATFLGWINYRLKHKNLPLGSPIPPLLQIERRLFNLTYIGIAFLTVTLSIGLLFLPSPFGEHNFHKTILASTAWGVYLYLILGHKFFGWRGSRIVRISYLGIFILSFAYVGNRLIVGY